MISTNQANQINTNQLWSLLLLIVVKLRRKVSPQALASKLSIIPCAFIPPIVLPCLLCPPSVGVRGGDELSLPPWYAASVVDRNRNPRCRSRCPASLEQGMVA